MLRLQQLLGNEFPTSELHLTLPPDEAIPMGCALQAAIMQERGEGGRRREGGEGGDEGVDVHCIPHDLWIMVR